MPVVVVLSQTLAVIGRDDDETAARIDRLLQLTQKPADASVDRSNLGIVLRDVEGQLVMTFEP